MRYHLVLSQQCCSATLDSVSINLPELCLYSCATTCIVSFYTLLYAVFCVSRFDPYICVWIMLSQNCLTIPLESIAPNHPVVELLATVWRPDATFPKWSIVGFRGFDPSDSAPCFKFSEFFISFHFISLLSVFATDLFTTHSKTKY